MRLDPKQAALLEWLIRAGYPQEHPHYTVTQPGKPDKDAILIDLLRRYVARRLHDYGRI